jgi:hypothetical protein
MSSLETRIYRAIASHTYRGELSLIREFARNRVTEEQVEDAFLFHCFKEETGVALR